MIRLTAAALALAGTLAATAATADARPAQPGPDASYSCRLAWNATTHMAEHPDTTAALHQLAVSATRACRAGQ